MITIGIHEAKSQLGQLAQSAAAGQVVLLTKRGRPLAELRPAQDIVPATAPRDAIAELRQWRTQLDVGNFDLDSLRSEGRR